jgi:hypothetical protein
MSRYRSLTWIVYRSEDGSNEEQKRAAIGKLKTFRLGGMVQAIEKSYGLPKSPYSELKAMGATEPNSLKRMAGPTGLEPATSCVTGRRSNQLNYGPTLRNNHSQKT